jgi:extracellular elastinolytic metalloproteinase
VAPRPRAPDLTLRSFDVPQTRASHVRLRVLTNQCTGQPAYHGDQDNDPLNVTDCVEGSMQDENVRAAELQVFAR